MFAVSMTYCQSTLSAAVAIDILLMITFAKKLRKKLINCARSLLDVIPDQIVQAQNLILCRCKNGGQQCDLDNHQADHPRPPGRVHDLQPQVQEHSRPQRPHAAPRRLLQEGRRRQEDRSSGRFRSTAPPPRGVGHSKEETGWSQWQAGSGTANIIEQHLCHQW